MKAVQKIGLFLLFAFMATCLLISIRACNDQKKENKELSSAYEQAVKTGVSAPLEVIKRVTDTVYQTSTATVRPIHTQDPDVSKYVSKTYADSIARALDIAVKNINSLSRVTVKLRDSIHGILSQDQDRNQ